VGTLDRGGALALGIAAAPAALLFAGLALPYLQWSHTVGFQGPRPIESVAPRDAFALIAPRLELGWRGVLPVGVSFDVPLAVFAAGCVALFGGWRAFPGETSRRIRAAGLGVGAPVGVAFVFALRRDLGPGAHPPPPPGEPPS